MKIKVFGKTYTSIKKNSLAWYTWKVIQAVGYIAISVIIAALLWAFVSLTIIVLG